AKVGPPGAFRLLPVADGLGKRRKAASLVDRRQLGQRNPPRRLAEQPHGYAVATSAGIIAAGPEDLAALALHAPLAGPIGLWRRADPAAAVADHHPPLQVAPRRTHSPPSKLIDAAAAAGSANLLQGGFQAWQLTWRGSWPSTMRMRSKCWTAMSSNSGWRSA